MTIVVIVIIISIFIIVVDKKCLRSFRQKEACESQLKIGKIVYLYKNLNISILTILLKNRELSCGK